VNPAHPIAEGLGSYIELEREEMYGEHFDIPAPDELVFVSWFEGGEVFRSGVTYHRGQGKIFYFRPGHETYPTYYNEQVLKVISNGVRWAAPVHGAKHYYGHHKPLEPIRSRE
jgi:trehalose utilization protein